MLPYGVWLSLLMPTVVSLRSLSMVPEPNPQDCSRDSLPPDERPQYFPAQTFGVGGAFTAIRYSCYLRAMQESPLSRSVTLDRDQVYRLTVIPAFRHPFIIRLGVRSDGSGALVVKAAKSQDDAGALTLDEMKEITKPDVDIFLRLLGESGFWSMPTSEVYSNDPRVIVKVMDGVEWVLEGAQGGRYHVVTRTSPKPGSYTELTSYFFRTLAKLDLPPSPVPRGRQ